MKPFAGVRLAAPFELSASFLAAKDAHAIEVEWTDLAANAVESNPFYSPSQLIPALAAFADENVRIAIVRDQRGRLIALAPFAPEHGYSRLPVRYFATWMHEHCFFAAPLIRRGLVKEALAALFDLVESEGAFLRLRHLDADGTLHRTAKEAAFETGRLVAPSARFQRALLQGEFQTDAYLKSAMRSKKRKEIRRLRARLEEEGAVAFESLKEADDLDGWTDDFLRLESAGWKGAENTALASSPEGKAYFIAALRRTFKAGTLDFHRLTVGGSPIAMIVNFIERGAGFSFKIAFDEAYARYSPGVMLEIEMMRALETREGLSFVDSCAAPGHPMINSLWRQRRMIEALNVSGRSAGSKILLGVLTVLEKTSEALRRRNSRAGEIESDNDDL